jgi:ribosomal protein L7/L12
MIRLQSGAVIPKGRVVWFGPEVRRAGSGRGRPKYSGTLVAAPPGYPMPLVGVEEVWWKRTKGSFLNGPMWLQKTRPAPGGKWWWYYNGAVYVSAESWLGVDDVKALLDERENRKSQRLQRAHEAQRQEQHRTSPGRPGAGGSANPDAQGAATPRFDVLLMGIGRHEAEVIEVIRDATGLGHGEIKALVGSPPRIVGESILERDARALHSRLAAVGAITALFEVKSPKSSGPEPAADNGAPSPPASVMQAASRKRPRSTATATMPEQSARTPRGQMNPKAVALCVVAVVVLILIAIGAGNSVGPTNSAYNGNLAVFDSACQGIGTPQGNAGPPTSATKIYNFGGGDSGNEYAVTCADGQTMTTNGP